MMINFTHAQLEMQRICLNFGQDEIIPHLEALEKHDAERNQLFQKMAQRGFFSLSYGESSSDYLGYVLALLAIAKADAGIAVTMSVTNMAGEAIDLYGTEGQKSRYLEGLADGSLVPAAFALTEKNAGSDAKSIETQALRDPQDSAYFIINGYKQFITNADTAGVIILFAVTNLVAGSKGITAFLIDKGTPGFNIVKHEQKLGLLTAHLVDLQFKECRIHQSQLLGQEGQGFEIAMHSLDSGRIGIAAQAVGIAEAAFEAAQKYALERHQFGKPIIEHQAIAFKLADMHMKLEAAKLLLWKAVSLKERGEPVTLAASTAKLYASEICNEIATESLQIHGGYGYVKGLMAEKYFRDARATTIYEGTSEIQRMVIAKHLQKFENN